MDREMATSSHDVILKNKSSISTCLNSKTPSLTNQFIELNHAVMSKDTKVDANTRRKSPTSREFRKEHHLHQEIEDSPQQTIGTTRIKVQELMIRPEGHHHFMKYNDEKIHKNVFTSPRIYIFGVQRDHFTKLELREIILRKIAFLLMAYRQNIRLTVKNAVKNIVN